MEFLKLFIKDIPFSIDDQLVLFNIVDSHLSIFLWILKTMSKTRRMRGSGKWKGGRRKEEERKRR